MHTENGVSLTMRNKRTSLNFPSNLMASLKMDSDDEYFNAMSISKKSIKLAKKWVLSKVFRISKPNQRSLDNFVC